jgi:hypothetical protein
MFFLGFLWRNVLPPFSVLDLHEMFRIHASIQSIGQRIGDVPDIHAPTRSAQRFSVSSQTDMATLEGFPFQRECNALEDGKTILEKSVFIRIEPVNGYPTHHERFFPSAFFHRPRASHPNSRQQKATPSYRLRRWEDARFADLAERTTFLAVVLTLLAPAPTNFLARRRIFFRAFFFGSFEPAFLAASAIPSATSLAVRTAIPTVEPIERATLSIVV